MPNEIKTLHNLRGQLLIFIISYINNLTYSLFSFLTFFLKFSEFFSFLDKLLFNLAILFSILVKREIGSLFSPSLKTH